jgi:hypothetical protein
MIVQEAQPTNDRRNWMRFSLRTLVTVMLIVSAYYAGRAPMLHRVERAERERDMAMQAPQIIPLYYADAQTVADAIRQTFARQVAKGSPAPILSVDRRSNSLIVSASRSVFVEIRAMATGLDQAQSPQRTKPVRVWVTPVNDRLLRSVEDGMAADALEHEQRFRDALQAPDFPGQR